MNKLKHISNTELLNEVKSRIDNQIITRKNLLNLAKIDWCLECSSNEMQENGCCLKCNNDHEQP